MASDTKQNGPAPTLKAEYSAPKASKTFEYSLPNTDTTSTEGKTAYMSALRASVGKLQEDINAYLTTKMEEDKVLASAASAKVDDKKEEDNYGEEGEDVEG